ncbi:MAG: uracil-DNA glycosylase [Christensenellaceae bacterium]|nr:uracil-DNA glycosylase [Christensenellaceae bacterium]
MLTWDSLKNQIEQCKACALHLNCTNKVMGQGNTKAKLMLIGEGPGKQEDEQGLAFVGAAGQLLTKMLAAINLSRDDVYICNVVKCRPPGNRAPTDIEIETCLNFLRAQVYLVRPSIILILGSTAMKAILGPEYKISKARGIWFERAGVFMIGTYHPAALLYNSKNKIYAWEDLKKLRKKLDEIEAL